MKKLIALIQAANATPATPAKKNGRTLPRTSPPRATHCEPKKRTVAAGKTFGETDNTPSRLCVSSQASPMRAKIAAKRAENFGKVQKPKE